ncbi:uncharacterized protein [Brachyistius frenatus]|uniref:uncharacterized protein n=1 Tax=Brachyistius frenatus TaxID=100188 RepID=UPI0037E8B34D
MSVKQGQTHFLTPPPPSLCSEESRSLRILLTKRQADQSAASQDQQSPPLSTCLVKPLPPKSSPVSDAASGAVAPTGSPREESRTWSLSGKPLPALYVDTSLGDLAPPPPPEEEDHPAQWTRTSPVAIPAQAPPPPSLYSPPSVGTNDRCHLMMKLESYYSRHPQATPTDSSPSPILAPPPTFPTRNWSCLHPDQPDVVDSPNPPISPLLYSSPDSPSDAPPFVIRTASPPPPQDYRAALPVERWAENVNRYYGSQSATGGEGGGVKGGAAPGEELSELDSLYQASLLAPSMHRGSRGVSPQPAGSKPVPLLHLPLFPLLHLPLYFLSFIFLFISSPSSSSLFPLLHLPLCFLSFIFLFVSPPPLLKDPSVSRPPFRPTDLHPSFSSSSPSHPSISSLHLPFPSSSTTDHPHPRHRGPSAPAPPPQHPPSQTQRPPSSGSSSWGRSGPGPGLQQQVLVVPDRRPSLSGQSVHSVALSYGTLPRAPRRAPPSSSSTLPRPKHAPPPGPQSLYATLVHPRRSASSNGLHCQPPPGKVGGASGFAPQHLQVPGDTPSRPRRLDVPPEGDWRREADYRQAQPGSSWDRRSATLLRPPHRLLRGPALCSLCQQLPAEPPRSYCPSCAARLARFHPVS